MLLYIILFIVFLLKYYRDKQKNRDIKNITLFTAIYFLIGSILNLLIVILKLSLDYFNIVMILLGVVLVIRIIFYIIKNSNLKSKEKLDSFDDKKNLKSTKKELFNEEEDKERLIKLNLPRNSLLKYEESKTKVINK